MRRVGRGIEFAGEIDVQATVVPDESGHEPCVPIAEGIAQNQDTAVVGGAPGEIAELGEYRPGELVIVKERLVLAAPVRNDVPGVEDSGEGRGGPLQVAALEECDYECADQN